MSDFIAFVLDLFPQSGNEDRAAALVLFVAAVVCVVVMAGFVVRHHREHWED